MRIAVVRGRAKVVRGNTALDVARASGGRFGPDPRAVYENWGAFRDWADSVAAGLGKSFPGFTPFGPMLVTLDEFADCEDIPVACLINGSVVQSSSTAELIFSVSELIAYLSAALRLLTGDLILTGTPAGIGMGRTPPSYLKNGDEIVTRVGDQTMRHVAIAPPPTTEEATS